MSKTLKWEDLSPAQQESLQRGVQDKFGGKLDNLKKRLENDHRMFGMASKETIRLRDQLMAQILEEKHKNER